MAAKQDKGAVAKQVADALRSAVETAQGKVDIGGGELTWLEYTRGKDLARHLRDHVELMEQLVRPQAPDRTTDDQVNDVVVQLLQRKLLLGCERKFKKPKPGRTKLVKWPRTLDGTQDKTWREDAFYAWTYDRPTSAWFYVMSALVVVAVLGVTLFPLAPHWVRLAVLYALTGLLIVLLGTILLRYLVWGFVWAITGHHLWLLPNLMSETLPITEIFSPTITFEKHESGKPAYAARAATFIVLLGLGYTLHRTAPDAKAVKKNIQDAHSSLLEYLDLMNVKDALGNGTTTNGTIPNATARAAGAPGAGSKASSRAAVEDDEAEAEEEQQQQDTGGDGSGSKESEL